MTTPSCPRKPAQGRTWFIRFALALVLFTAMVINLHLLSLVATADDETASPPMEGSVATSTAYGDRRAVVSPPTPAPTTAAKWENRNTASSQRNSSPVADSNTRFTSIHKSATPARPAVGNLSDHQQYSNATLCYLALERKKHRWFDHWISLDVPLLDSVLRIVRKVSPNNSSLSAPALRAEGEAMEAEEEEEVEEVYQVLVVVKHLGHDKQYWNQARWFCNTPDHPGKLIVSNTPVHVIECTFPLGRRRRSSVSSWELPSSTTNPSSLLHTIWPLPPFSSDLRRTIDGMQSSPARGTGGNGDEERIHYLDNSNNTESRVLVRYDMVSEFAKCDDLEQLEFWAKMRNRGFYRDPNVEDNRKGSLAAALHTNDSDLVARQEGTTKLHLPSVFSGGVSFPNFYIDPTVPTLEKASTSLPRAPKKIFLGACVIVREVGPLIRPWLEYHRLLGFEHFWIYVNEPFTEEAKGNQSWKRNRKHVKMEDEDDITYIPYDFYWNNHGNHSPIYQKPKFNIFHQEPMQMKCLYHAKRWGIEWVTTTDVDEYIWVNETRFLSEHSTNDTFVNTSTSTFSTPDLDSFGPASIFPLKAFLMENAEKYRYTAGLTMNSAFFGQHPKKELAKRSESHTRTPLLMDYVYRHEKPKWQRYKVLYHPSYARVAEVHIVKGYPNVVGKKTNFNPRLRQVYFQHYKNAAKGVAKTKAGQRLVHDSALRDAYRARVLAILCGEPPWREQHDLDCERTKSELK